MCPINHSPRQLHCGGCHENAFSGQMIHKDDSEFHAQHNIALLRRSMHCSSERGDVTHKMVATWVGDEGGLTRQFFAFIVSLVRGA